MKTYANRTDEELALLYTAGDNKAFDELLARNQQKLFNYILFDSSLSALSLLGLSKSNT
jgi:RNA polymerase sigma-70 factor (ECF subfamily)